MACKLLIFLPIEQYYGNLGLSPTKEEIITLHCPNLSKCSILVDLFNF